MDATLVLTFAFCAAFLMWAGAYLYQRGIAKASVMPKVVERIINPDPTAFKPIPPRCPVKTCPYCKKDPKWICTPDESQFVCSLCKKSISGPKPRIEA